MNKHRCMACLNKEQSVRFYKKKFEKEVKKIRQQKIQKYFLLAVIALSVFADFKLWFS